jgi:hypothetical protein
VVIINATRARRQVWKENTSDEKDKNGYEKKKIAALSQSSQENGGSRYESGQKIQEGHGEVREFIIIEAALAH